MLTIDNLYMQLKVDLENFTQSRKKDVARGAETAELAGVIVQTYGDGLEKALRLAANLGGHPTPALMDDVDRCVAEIDPSYETTFALRINARPTGLLFCPVPDSE